MKPITIHSGQTPLLYGPNRIRIFWASREAEAPCPGDGTKDLENPLLGDRRGSPVADKGDEGEHLFSVQQKESKWHRLIYPGARTFLNIETGRSVPP